MNSDFWKNLEARLATALKELGETQEDVLATLLSGNFLGQRGKPTNCPLYHYLLAKVGYPLIHLGYEGAYVYESAYLYQNRKDRGCVPFPSVVRQTMSRFDNGGLDQLTRQKAV